MESSSNLKNPLVLSEYFLLKSAKSDWKERRRAVLPPTRPPFCVPSHPATLMKRSKEKQKKKRMKRTKKGGDKDDDEKEKKKKNERWLPPRKVAHRFLHLSADTIDAADAVLLLQRYRRPWLVLDPSSIEPKANPNVTTEIFVCPFMNSYLLISDSQNLKANRGKWPTMFQNKIPNHREKKKSTNEIL